MAPKGGGKKQMKGGFRVVTDKMLELERLVGPPVKDEVEPWTRGTEPAASQTTSGWTAVLHRPYQALGVPVLDFDDPLTILRAQEAISESALPEVEELPPPPPPVTGAIPLGQRDAGKTLLHQAKMSAAAVQRCKAGGWFYDTLRMQGLQPPQAGEKPAGGVEAVKHRLAEYEAGRMARDSTNNGGGSGSGAPSPNRSWRTLPRHSRGGMGGDGGGGSGGGGGGDGGTRGSGRSSGKAAALGDAQVAKKLAAEAAAQAEARRLLGPRGNIAGRRYHTFVHRDRAAAPSTSNSRPGTSGGMMGGSGGGGAAAEGGTVTMSRGRPGTSGSTRVTTTMGGTGLLASRPSTAASALDTFDREGWAHLFAPAAEAVESPGAAFGDIIVGDNITERGARGGGGGGGDIYDDDGLREPPGPANDGDEGEDEEEEKNEGGWGVDSFVAGTAMTAATAAVRAIRTPVAAVRSSPGSRGGRGSRRPNTSGGVMMTTSSSPPPPPGIVAGAPSSTNTRRRPNTSHGGGGGGGVRISFGRKPPSPIAATAPRPSTSNTAAGDASKEEKMSSWTETMFGATMHTVKPPEDKADKVAMASFAFLSSKHEMDAGLNDTLDRLTKDRAGMYKLKSSALNDTAAQFRFPSDLSREIPSARTHAEMLSTRAAIQRVEEYSWYKKMYSHVASQIKHDGSLSKGEQHIVTNVTRILVDGHRFTRDDMKRIIGGLDLEDHLNMDVQFLIRLLVDNLGVTRAEYETWFESAGRASKKEIMRYFDKGVKETQQASVSINAVRFVAKLRSSTSEKEGKERRESELIQAREKVHQMHAQAATIRRNSTSRGLGLARSPARVSVASSKASVGRQP